MKELYDQAYESCLNIDSNFQGQFKDLFQIWRSRFFKDEQSYRVLELGCGCSSVFEKNDFPFIEKVVAIDFSKKSIEKAIAHSTNLKIEYRACDILEVSGEFDLIVDSHCLHCLVDIDLRKKSLAHLKSLLSSPGVILGETMVRGKGLAVSEPYHSFDNDPKIYKFFKGDLVPVRYAPTSIEIESEFLSHFKIEYFYIPYSEKIIIDDSREYPLKSDPDILKYILSKVD